MIPGDGEPPTNAEPPDDAGGNGSGREPDSASPREPRFSFWQRFALLALLLAAVFLFTALALSAFDRGPFAPTAARTGVAQERQRELAAEATTRRAQASSAAIRAAADLASTLAPLGASATTTAREGTGIVHDFLKQVGFPLTEKGISKLASTLWNRFAVHEPPPIPAPIFIDGVSPERERTIKVIIVLRDHRRVQVIRVPDDG